MLIAHGPIAIIATKLSNGRLIKTLKKKELILLYTFSFFLGIFPDFDIFYLASVGKPPFLHHSLLSHTPILWIVITILVAIALEYFKWPKTNTKRKIIYITILASSISHMLADLIGGHIMFFTPFYSQYLTILGNIFPDNLFAGYFANPLFALEILFVSICLLYLLYEFINLKLFTLIVLPIAYLIFNLYTYSSVYQVDIFKKDNGNPIFDTDEDRLADSYDYDVDNNFVDNFKQVTKVQLISEFEKVFSSTTILPAKNRTFEEQIKYTYGGHTLLRAILQAYAQTGNYLTPVVSDYMNRNNIESFSKALFPYLFSTNTFKKSSEVKEVKPGALVIIKYSDEEYSLGIVLNNLKLFIQNEDGVPLEMEMKDISQELFIQE
jgi:hypothetical protein